MKEIALSEMKDQLSKFLHEAGGQGIVITRHGKPAGILIGFESEDDWFDFRLENDPSFLRRVAEARESLRSGKGIPWDEAVGRKRRLPAVVKEKKAKYRK